MRKTLYKELLKEPISQRKKILCAPVGCYHPGGRERRMIIRRIHRTIRPRATWRNLQDENHYGIPKLLRKEKKGVRKREMPSMIIPPLDQESTLQRTIERTNILKKKFFNEDFLLWFLSIPTLLGGEDMDFLINGKMFGYLLYFGDQLSVIHYRPPRTHLYRW